MKLPSKKDKKGKSRKRDLVEIGVILCIFAVLYFTGLHTDVAGFMQQALLKTGIHNADGSDMSDNYGKTDYNMTFHDAGGKEVKLAHYKNKVVFLNFWATWCPPCIAEMPDIQDLYADMEQKGIVFVMVSMDENPEKAKSFLKKKGFQFPVYFPASQIPQEFSSNSIPTTFVIDPQGNIRFKKMGMANYDTQDFRNFLISLQKEELSLASKNLY